MLMPSQQCLEIRLLQPRQLLVRPLSLHQRGTKGQLRNAGANSLLQMTQATQLICNTCLSLEHGQKFAPCDGRGI